MSALATFRTYLESHSGCDRSDDMLLQLASNIADEEGERALHVDAEAEADALFDESVEQRQGEFYKMWWHKVVDKEKEEYSDERGQADKDKLCDLVDLLNEGERERSEMWSSHYRLRSTWRDLKRKRERAREEVEAKKKEKKEKKERAE